MRLPRLPLVTALALLFFFAYITGIRLAYSLLYALLLIFIVSYFWSRLPPITSRSSAPARRASFRWATTSRALHDRESVVDPDPADRADGLLQPPGLRPRSGLQPQGPADTALDVARAVQAAGPLHVWSGRVALRRSLRPVHPIAPRRRQPLRRRLPGGPAGRISRRAGPSTAGDEQLRGRVLDIPPNTTRSASTCRPTA